MPGLMTPPMRMMIPGQERPGQGRPDRERIPSTPTRGIFGTADGLAQQQAYQPMGQQGQQGGSPSQGMFASYMQDLFRQKYRPQQALGGYQNFGAFGGFMPPSMPQAQPQNQVPPWLQAFMNQQQQRPPESYGGEGPGGPGTDGGDDGAY